MSVPLVQGIWTVDRADVHHRRVMDQCVDRLRPVATEIADGVFVAEVDRAVSSGGTECKLTQGWDGASQKVEPVAIGGQATGQSCTDPARCARHDHRLGVMSGCCVGHQATASKTLVRPERPQMNASRSHRRLGGSSRQQAACSPSAALAPACGPPSAIAPNALISASESLGEPIEKERLDILRCAHGDRGASRCCSPVRGPAERDRHRVLVIEDPHRTHGSDHLDRLIVRRHGSPTALQLR